MPKKELAWSHSALDSFETCPKKHYHLKVKKDFKESFGEAADYGKKAHKFFENYMMHDIALPMDLQHHRKILDPLKAAKGEAFGEQQLAITRDYEPTGWFDDDVWCRAIIDWMKINGDKAVIIDWKFGKMKDEMQQLNLFAAFLAIFRPEVNSFSCAFYWAKEKKFTRHKVTRAEVPELWNGILPKVQRYELAHKTLDFPARESGLCKRHCPVTSCPNNGAFL